MGRIVIVEADVKAGKVALMLAADARDQLFRSDAFFLGAQHDGGAVGVIGAHVIALVPLHFLKAHPDVGLDVFHHVAEVDGAVGVGQGAGDQDFSSLFHLGLQPLLASVRH